MSRYLVEQVEAEGGITIHLATRVREMHGIDHHKKSGHWQGTRVSDGTRTRGRRDHNPSKSGVLGGIRLLRRTQPI
jgi:hypothetical protein